MRKKSFISRKAITSLTKLGISVAISYFFDPVRGSQRRAMIRDKMSYAINKGRQAIEAASRGLKNRATGVSSELRTQFNTGNSTDKALAERVQSKVGYFVSDPNEIAVSVLKGIVTLSGSVLAQEVKSLITSISELEGVKKVENHLDIHGMSDSSD